MRNEFLQKAVDWTIRIVTVVILFYLLYKLFE